MGKLKQAMIDEEEQSNSGNYLTMARLCNKEWKKYLAKNVWGKGLTGMTELQVHNAFQAGFFEGFCFRFTGEEE